MRPCLRLVGAALGAALLASLVCLAGPAGAGADERVLDFGSHIAVRPDSSLVVTETIKVRAEGRQIKRGIVREFPTSYRDRHGRRVQVGFSLRKVERDGRAEPYHIKQASNGVRIYIGKSDRFIPPGEHTYRITYRTDRQLGFFADYDELYWNVTGNGWSLPIDHARAVVDLPPGARVLQHAAYTGPAGAKGKDFVYALDGRGRPQWTTTKALPPGQGLTIAVAWPKGLVTQPPPPKVPLLVRLGPLAGPAGMAALLLYYLLAWLLVGRDPRRGTIIPLFEPPQGLSPAAMRFIKRMGFDHKAFAAAVVDMAVKGYLTIAEDDDKVFTLTGTGHVPPSLSRGEGRLGMALFKGDRSIDLKRGNHARVGAAVKALREALQAEYEKASFELNRSWLLPGVLITLLALAALVLTAPDPGAAAGMALWLALWSGGCYFLSKRVLAAWRGARGLAGGLAALGITFFAAPFLAGAVVGLFIFGSVAGPAGPLWFVALLLVTPVFQYLLKAPTVAGRRLMDGIEGFERFLTVAEKDRLEMLHPPERTPELFERYLPYALALDVEQKWAQQFAQVLERAGEPYQPGWYHGRSFDSHWAGDLAGRLGGSLTGAVSSSSTAPGSSSGSGGGGSSGGGGGGGGGSGW